MPARRPEPLDVRAQRLYASLPPTLQPALTRERFPHVVNRIAAEWEIPTRFAKLMDELLLDARGHRTGFPYEAVRELTALREHYFAALPPDAPPRRAARGAARRPCVWGSATARTPR